MNFAKALLLAIGFHLLLAVGIGLALEFAPSPDVLVQLDLSSVELSFAEDVSEADPAVPLPPVPEPPPPEPPPPEDPPPPELEPLPDLPPDPEALKLSDPEPERPEMPPVPEPAEERTPEQVERESVPEPEPPSVQVAAPRQARIDAPPAPKRTIRPEYPKGSRQRGEQGDVVVEIRVGEDGRVDGVSVSVSSGFPELDAAALKAVRNARFTPAKSAGRSVSSTARLTLSFKLR